MAASSDSETPPPAAEGPAPSETDILFERGRQIVEETRKLLADFKLPELKKPRSRTRREDEPEIDTTESAADPEAGESAT